MGLFKKNKKINEAETQKDKSPWWIAALAELVFIFLVSYTRAKKKQEERNGTNKNE